MRIGSALADMRQRAGRSQQDVAAHIGVSYQQIGKYERGEDGISAARLEEIYEYLHGPDGGDGFGEGGAIFHLQRHARLLDMEALRESVQTLSHELKRLHRLLGVTDL